MVQTAGKALWQLYPAQLTRDLLFLIVAHHKQPRPFTLPHGMARFKVFLLLFWLVGGFGEGERYFLYSVNRGEGFNLRRDVHMRAATLVNELRARSGENWILVLPPWPRLYHWKSRDVQHSHIKWEAFFDVPSLNRYVPSIEFEDYLQLQKGIQEVGKGS